MQKKLGSSVRIFSVIFTLSMLAACHRAERFTAIEWQQIAAEKQAKFRGCIPELEADANSKVHLALASIRNETDTTTATIVAYATTEAADFYLPQYIMSRGRWMINETSRSYIRDENCREYRMQDRKPAIGNVPESGMIKLKAGEAYEVTLIFPRLADEVHKGVLVYGKWMMPFTLAP